MSPDSLTPQARHAEAPAVTPGARALYSIATSFEAADDSTGMLTALVRRSAEAVGTRRGWLLVGEAPKEAAVAAWPDDAEAPGLDSLRLPLLHAGRPAGTLVLAAPSAGAFSPAERKLAFALAHPAGTVAALALRLAAAETRAREAGERCALQADLVAAVDHDLRTPLTTVVGALQTLARPEFAPADPDLAALLTSALGQAQRLRSLLGDLLLAASPEAHGEDLPPHRLRELIAEAARAGTGESGAVPIEIPADLPPVTVDPTALRRVLDGVLRRACRQGLAARAEVAAWGEDLLIAVSVDGAGPLVPELSARLAAAVGGRLEESRNADGNAVVQLVLPGALRPAPIPDRQRLQP